MLFPEPVVRLVATGFSPEKAALCATLVRIMMPFLPAISLAVVAMGALNAEEKYTAPGAGVVDVQPRRDRRRRRRLAARRRRRARR